MQGTTDPLKDKIFFSFPAPPPSPIGPYWPNDQAYRRPNQPFGGLNSAPSVKPYSFLPQSILANSHVLPINLIPSFLYCFFATRQIPLKGCAETLHSSYISPKFLVIRANNNGFNENVMISLAGKLSIFLSKHVVVVHPPPPLHLSQQRNCNFCLFVSPRPTER